MPSQTASLQTQEAQPQDIQLQFCDEPVAFDVKMWLELGQELMKVNDFTQHSARALQWDIGDWLVEGEDEGITRKALKTKEFKRHALRITKYKSWGALKNLMTIVRRVPESRRRDGREGRKYLSFTIHQEIAKKFREEEHQEKLFEIAENADRWIGDKHKVMSTRDLQRKIQVLQSDGELPKTAFDKKIPEGQKLTMYINSKDFTTLERWAAAKYGSRYRVAQMVMWMAAEYSKDHRVEIEEMCIAVEEARAAKEAERKKLMPEPPEQRERRYRLRIQEGFDRLSAEVKMRAVEFAFEMAWKENLVRDTEDSDNLKPPAES